MMSMNQIYFSEIKDLFRTPLVDPYKTVDFQTTLKKITYNGAHPMTFAQNAK